VPIGPGQALWVLADVTELHEHQQQVEHLAYHDALTGLPNRLLLADRLQQAVALAQRYQRSLAVCLLDLDGFKDVNDAHGHAAGDLLLRTVAQRLQACLRANDTVSRLGGDEFVLVLSLGDPPESDIADAGAAFEAVLQRVAQALAEPVELAPAQAPAPAPGAVAGAGAGDAAVPAPQAPHPPQARVAASMGLALYPADAREPDALIRLADQAMYRAKQRGRGRICRWPAAADE
jgi:diguanylate cyclase (GGDEF)-like protein